MAENRQYYHDKGEQDAADGRYDPPPGGWLHRLVFTPTEQEWEEKEAYDAGYEHHQHQVKDR